MIESIQPLNFPKDDNDQVCASLSAATCTLSDMGEKTITSTIKVDGQIAPDFSRDWEVEFKGEKYIMPLRSPQGSKDNESMLSSIDLTFQHWAVYQLKRFYFCTMPDKDAGVAIPDQYIASVSLNLKDFCILFNQVLDYYFHGKISLDFNDPASHENGWEYSIEPTAVEISHSYIWDVLTQFYELYAVRWQIEPRSDNDNQAEDGERYVIRVGYPATTLSHIFKYGFNNGLLKVERQVQDENIRNMIIGRGGEKNLPYRYFKKHDSDNASFAPDPDWIPELADIYFSELRGATFRSYIQGWKAAHLQQYREKYPDEIWKASVTSADKAYSPWAWQRGYTDNTFNPVEYVADAFDTAENGYAVVEGSSIKRYGQLQGGLENNDDIYPTIQGVTIDGLGRVDQAVWVEPIVSDNVEEAAETTAEVLNINGVRVTETIKAGERKKVSVIGGSFSVGSGRYANFDEGSKTVSATKDVYTLTFESILNGKWEKSVERVETDYGAIVIEDASISVVNLATGETHSASGIPEGQWRYTVEFSLHNSTKETLNVTVACENPTVVEADASPDWGDTWEIYVKNIWQSRLGFSDDGAVIPNETASQYAERVWSPILGDRTGGEAKVVFTTGWLSTSEDYEFTIVATPEYDTSKTLYEFADGICSADPSLSGSHGGIVSEYHSEWKLTLAKSDADLESTGLYLPSTKRQAEAGDCFFFIGIDMPHMYVVEAEKRLDDYKKDELDKVKDIKPTWVVSLDKVRIHNHGNPGAIVDSLVPGAQLTLEDSRFIDGNNRQQLYISAITYTYIEPTDTEANILPDVELTLSDEIESSGDAVSELSGEVSAIQRQIGSISNAVKLFRAVGDKIYLRKDGFADRSVSPTEFLSMISSVGFRNGIAGGAGWGFFKDSNGNWVLEIDRINVRRDMQVNSIVVNQIEGRGGMSIDSAAFIETESVAETDSEYLCYFDQRGGSLANLFKVDDVAYCSRFSPDNLELRAYKRRVVAVGTNFIALTKGYAPIVLADGSTDTGVNGDGAPRSGDVIVHFGSYSDKERQHVKIRDVIGGGYERYVEGLDSVNAAGTEYYFIGKQSGVYGDKARFFVGGDDSFIRFEDGKVSIQAEISALSTIGGTVVDDYMNGIVSDSIAQIQLGDRNLLFNTAKSYSTPSPAKDDNTAYPSELYTTVELVQGETYSIRAKCQVSTMNLQDPKAEAKFTDDHYSAIEQSSNSKIAGAKTILASLWLWGDGGYQLVSDSSTNSANGTVFTMNCPSGIYHIRLNTYGAVGEFSELMLVKGNLIASEWTAAPEDTDNKISAFDYLRKAMEDASAGSTTVSGGLILTSLIKVGYSGTDSRFYTQSGIGGGIDETQLGYGLALWAGGEQIDRAVYGESEPSAALFAIRQDGTGYAAGNTIRFNRSSLSVGDSIRIDDGGFFMSDGSEERLRIENAPITDVEADATEDNITISATIGGNIMIAEGHFVPTESLGNEDNNNVLQGTLSEVNGDGIIGGELLGGDDVVLPATPQPDSGDSDSAVGTGLYIVRGYSKEIFSGELGAGSKIAIQLNMELAAPENLSGAAFRAVIIKDGIAVQTIRQTLHYSQPDSGGLWCWNGATELNFSVIESGVYSVVVGMSASGAIADSSSVMVTSTGRAQGFINMPFTTKTVIANNGLLSSWGHSLLFVNHAGTKIRATDISIKSDRAGIEVHDNVLSVIYSENGSAHQLSLADYIRKIVSEM